MPAICSPEHQHLPLPQSIFVKDLSRLTGKTEHTIRTYARYPKYAHLIPQPVRRFPGSNRLYWLVEDVMAWVSSTTPAYPPPPRRPRGRPTKREVQARARWKSEESNAGGAS